MRLIFLLTCIILAGIAHANDKLRPPNVVIIFTDDLGYGDIGVFGAKGYKTPHLDKMAAEGRKFTRWYAAQPVCSASRAALLTGCYPNRIGIHGALGPASRVGISNNEMTLAELFKQKGYTTACFGKWHLGDHEKFLPLQHGFDHYFGIPYSNDMWPLHPEGGNWPPLPIIEGNKRLRFANEHDQKMMTIWLTNKAVDFINTNRETPFFLYVPHPQPHVPLYVSDRFAGTTERGLFGDVISEIDWSVGEIINAIDTNGLTENTLVIFTSDNGPWLSYGTHAGSAGPLREGKGTVWEGGVREPTIMRWSGKIPAGTECSQPAMNIDLLPTLAKMIDAKLPNHKIDGLDIWPLLEGAPNAKNPHKGYCYYYHHNNLLAVSMGKWKLVLPHKYRTLGGKEGGKGGIPVKYASEKTELALYDLERDIEESTNVAKDHAEVVQQLLNYAETVRAELGDKTSNQEGSGTREPGRLNNEETTNLKKALWPEGRR